jgi:hypothetical protein
LGYSHFWTPPMWTNQSRSSCKVELITSTSRTGDGMSESNQRFWKNLGDYHMVWTIQWGYDSYELGMRCFGRVIFMCSTYFPHSYCYMNMIMMMMMTMTTMVSLVPFLWTFANEMVLVMMAKLSCTMVRCDCHFPVEWQIQCISEVWCIITWFIVDFPIKSSIYNHL